MDRVRGILLLLALLGGHLVGCSSSRKEYLLPKIGPDAEGKSAPTRRDDPDCVADSKNLVFRREACPRVGEIPESDKVLYESVYAALNLGYSPCKECRPLQGLR